LNRADLIVGEHYGNQNRVRPERGAHVVNAHDAVVINRQTRDFPSALFQRVADAAHRRMLNGRSDNVATLIGGDFRDAANRKVIGLRAAGKKHNFVRARAHKRRHVAPRAVNGGARLLTEEVDARSVTEFVRQKRQHRLDDAAVNRRRRAVIHVNSSHNQLSTPRAFTPDPPQQPATTTRRQQYRS